MVREEAPEGKANSLSGQGSYPQDGKGEAGVLQYTSLHTSCPTDLVTAWTGGPQVFLFPLMGDLMTASLSCSTLCGA